MENVTGIMSLCEYLAAPVAGDAADDLVDVVGPHLQGLLGEDDLPGGDVPGGHHVATKTGKCPILE